jgi:hypothetical protein
LGVAVVAVAGRGKPNGRWLSHERGGRNTKRPPHEPVIPECTRTDRHCSMRIVSLSRLLHGQPWTPDAGQSSTPVCTLLRRIVTVLSLRPRFRESGSDCSRAAPQCC